jgi:hypothetical protein
MGHMSHNMNAHIIQSVPYKMQPKDQTSRNNETSIQEAATLLQ